mgnify:CR=1 FL=1
MIYSYYYIDSHTCEKVEESLEEHTIKAIRVLSKLDSSRIARYLVKQVSNNLYHAFRDGVMIATVLHDAGKVFFQKNLQIKVDKKYLTFRGHELISAFLTNEILYKSLISNSVNLDISIKDSMRILATFSVLYHHHAMNIEFRRLFIREKSYQEGKGLISELEDLLLSIMKKIGLEKYIPQLNESFESLRSLLTKISNANLFSLYIKRAIDQDISRRIWRTIIKDPMTKKLSFLSLSLLITADYEAASKRGKASRFHYALRDFRSIYLN